MASGKVGDAWVDLSVKGDKISANSRRIMKQMESVMDAQAEKIGRSVGDAIANAMQRELIPEIKRMSKSLDYLARDRGMNINADADTTAADAELAKATRDRKVQIEAETAPLLKGLGRLDEAVRRTSSLSRALDIEGVVGKIPFLGSALKAQSEEMAANMEATLKGRLPKAASEASEQMNAAMERVTLAAQKRREGIVDAHTARLAQLEVDGAAEAGKAVAAENERWDRLLAAAKEKNADKSAAQISAIEQRYARQRGAAIQKINDKADADFRAATLAADNDLKAKLAASDKKERESRVVVRMAVDRSSTKALQEEVKRTTAGVRREFDKTLKAHLEQKLDIDLNQKGVMAKAKAVAAGVKTAIKGKYPIEVDLKQKGVLAKAKALSKGVKAALGPKAHKISLSLGGGTVLSQAKVLMGRLTATFAKGIKARIEARADTKAAKAEMAAAARPRTATIHVFAKMVKGSFAKIAGYAKALSGFTMLQSLRKAFSSFLTSLPQTAMAFTKVSLAIGAIAPWAMQAIAALGPLSGGLVAIAKGAIVAIPLLVATGAAAGILVSAFKDLKKSTGEAQRFYKNLQIMKANLGGLQKSIQKAFFASGEFNNAMYGINEMLNPAGPLTKGLKANSAAMATFLAGGLKGLREGFTDKNLKTFFGNMKDGLANATPGLQNMTKAFGIIATKGSAVFGGMGDKFSEWGESLIAWAEKADIEGMISNAAKQFGLLWDSMKAFGGIFKAVWGAMSAGTGSTGFASLLDTLNAVKAVVEGEGFQTAMTALFTGAAAGADALRNALGPIGKNLEVILPVLGTALSIAGGAAAAALTGISQVLANKAVGDGLIAALTAVSDLVAKMPWDIFGESLGVILQMIGQILPVITQLFALAAPDLLAAINGLIAPLGQIVMAFLPVINTLLAAITPVVAALAPIIQGLADAFSALFSGDASGFTSALTGAFEGIGPLIDTMVQSFADLLPQVISVLTALVPGIIQALTAALPTIVPAVMDALVSLADAFAQLVPILVQSLISLVPMLTEVFTSLIPSLVATIGTMIPVLVGAVLEMIPALINGIAAALPALLQAITTMLPQVIQSLLQIVPLVLQMLATVLPVIINSIVAMLPVLLQALIGMLPGIVNTIVGMLPSIIEAALALFMGLIDGLITALPLLIQSLLDALPQILSALIEMLPALIEGAVQLFLGLVSGLAAAIPRLLALVITLIPSIVSSLISMAIQLVEAGGELIVKLLQGLGDAAVKLWDWAKGIPGEIVKSMGDLGAAMMGAAKNLIDGFVNGIKDGFNRAKQAAMDMANGVVNAAKNIFGIKSPSKVFRRFGEQDGEGLAQGLKSSAKKVVKDVSGPFQSIGSSLNNAIMNGVVASASKSSSALSKAATIISNQYNVAIKNASAKRKKTLKGQADEAKKLLTGQQTATADIWENGDDAGTDALLAAIDSRGNWISTATKTLRTATMQDIAKAREVFADRIEDQKKVLEGILKDFESLKSKIADSITGELDLKGLRSVTQLTTTLGGMVSKAKAFAGKLKDLVAKGYPAALVQQVAGMGLVEGARVADVLLSATDAQTQQIQADYGALGDWANQAGTVVAGQMYNAGIAAQEGLIAGLEADMSRLEAAGQRIAEALVAAVKKKLQIKSPSKVFEGIGDNSVAGLVGGVEDGKAALAKSITDLSSMMTGGFSGSVTVPQAALMPNATPAPAAASSGGGNFYWNGDLMGDSDPRLKQAMSLLFEVLGDARRLSRSGPALGRVN